MNSGLIEADTNPDINSFKAIFAIMLLAVIAPEVFIVQPEWVKGLVTLVGFTESQAGQVAAIEMGGMWLTTLAMIFLSARLNWRWVLAASLLVVIVGNLACIGVRDFSLFMALRCAVGIGSGGVLVLSFAMVGLTANPDRYFGYIMVWVVLYAGVMLAALPSIYDVAGIAGALIFFAGLAACGLPFLRFLPTSGNAALDHQTDAPVINWANKIAALTAMLAYCIGLGVVWPYLSLIGVAEGIGEQAVANRLAFSQLFGVAGGVTAVVLAARYGRAWPIALAVAGTIGSVVLLAGDLTALVFASAACLFLYAWNVAQPYLLAAMASFDASGQMVVYAVAVQTTGLAVGPFLGASLIGEGDYTALYWCGAVFFAATVLLILPPIRAQARLDRGRD